MVRWWLLVHNFIILFIICGLLLVNVAAAETSGYWDRPASICDMYGVCSGSLIVEGNLTVNGDYVNITVTDYNVTGSINAENITGEYILASQYIGRGRANPKEKLDIYCVSGICRGLIESGNNQAALELKNDNGQLFTAVLNDGTGYFQSNENFRLISSNGNLLLESPTQFYEYPTIDGENICLSNGTDCTGGTDTNTWNSTTDILQAINHNNITPHYVNVTGDLWLGTGNNAVYKYQDNVLGIGTNDPTSKLHALDTSGIPQLELEYAGALTSTFETLSDGTLEIFAGGGAIDFMTNKIKNIDGITAGSLSTTTSVSVGTDVIAGTYKYGTDGVKVAVNDPVFCTNEYANACMIFATGGVGAGVKFNDAYGNEFIRLKTDGNISMQSPDSTWWNCGVSNSGVFSCS